MQVTASGLRQNIYKLLDKVIETGVPIEIIRKGKKLKIIPPEKKSKLNNLHKRDVIKGNPNELVHIDWSDEWKT
jgi:antitoxin (DNA-binding transcriptional repressor) of toxin-antitoxin stability system